MLPVRFVTLTCWAAIVLGKCVLANEDESAGVFVKDADPSNFDDLVINSKKFSLVGFFAPWCGHCKSIKPTWEKVAGLFGDEPHVQIVSVDADKHASLGEKYSVKGFPTLKFFGPDGKDVPYEAGRNLDDIVSFLNEKASTDVAADGTVTPSGGLLPKVHDVLTGFGSASPEEQHAMLEKAAAVVAADGKDLDRWSLYSKIGKKIIAEGMEYIVKERARVTRMLAKNSESLTNSQRKTFFRRVNVLSAFDEL